MKEKESLRGLRYAKRGEIRCYKWYCEYHTCSTNTCLAEDYGANRPEACEKGTRWYRRLLREAVNV